MQIHAMSSIYQLVSSVKNGMSPKQVEQKVATDTPSTQTEHSAAWMTQYDPRHIRPSELRTLSEHMLDSGQINFDEYTTLFMSTLEFTIDERGQAQANMKPDGAYNYYQIYQDSLTFHASQGDAQAATRYQNILGLFDKIIQGQSSTHIDTKV